MPSRVETRQSSSSSLVQDTAATSTKAANVLLYEISLIISFSSKIKGYIRYCKENYSDVSSRSIRWLIGIPVLLIPMLALSIFAFGCQTNEVFFLSISEFCLLPAILYLIWYVHNQAPSIEPPYDTTETVVPGQEIETMECDDDNIKVQQYSDMFDGFSRILEEKCNNDKIFLDSGLTRTDLAKILNTNTTYVSRYFASIDTNFNGYINDLRLEYACRLIRKTEHPDTLQMKSVSIASGFSNYHTVAHLFTEKLGVSPTKWCKGHCEPPT